MYKRQQTIVVVKVLDSFRNSISHRTDQKDQQSHTDRPQVLATYVYIGPCHIFNIIRYAISRKKAKTAL